MGEWWERGGSGGVVGCQDLPVFPVLAVYVVVSVVPVHVRKREVGIVGGLKLSRP